MGSSREARLAGFVPLAADAFGAVLAVCPPSLVTDTLQCAAGRSAPR